MNDVEAILKALGEYVEEGDQYRAVCPLDGGHHVIVDKTGRINVFGCGQTKEVWQWLESKSVHRNEIYIYRDRDGNKIFQHYTFIGKSGEPIRPFKVYTPNGVPVPHKSVKDKYGRLPLLVFNLPELVNAESAWLTEGEPDALALGRRLSNAVATTIPYGADTWRREYTDQLRHLQRLTIVADRDTEGYKGALLRYEALAPHIGKVRVVQPAEGCKDADAHFAAGHALSDFVPVSIQELGQLAQTSPKKVVRKVIGPPSSLAQVHAVYRKWLGDAYDAALVDIVMAVAVVERLKGDPAWLLVVGGSGSAKTETISPLIGAGARLVSTITSEAALLSATSEKQRSKNASGGLLAEIGDHGILVIKDFTTIISANRDTRAHILSALREVYDGIWIRDVGVDGGRSLTWAGRLVVIGGVTPAWDSAHEVISKMGDRFVIVRTVERGVDGGVQALSNLGSEDEMRDELQDIVGRLLAGVNIETAIKVPQIAQLKLVSIANIVTLLRTHVEYDRQGQPDHAFAREEPTRYVKQLMQIVRGGLILGMTLEDSMLLAFRCGRDSIPPRRKTVLVELARLTKATVTDLIEPTGLPYAAVRRTLTELWMLHVVQQDQRNEDTGGKQNRPYRIASGFDSSIIEEWF